MCYMILEINGWLYNKLNRCCLLVCRRKMSEAERLFSKFNLKQCTFNLVAINQR